MDRIHLENSQIPLHYQIADYLLNMLQNGDLDPAVQLPPEEELRTIFGVSRTTIRHALDHLLDKGLLRRKQGKGTFWTDSAGKLQKKKLTGINRQIFNITEKTTVKVLLKRKVRSIEKVSSFLRLPPHEEVTMFKRLRSVNTSPLSYTINYLSKEYGKVIEKRHLEKMTMLETLEKVCGINLGTIEHEVEITRANSDIAENLQVSTLDPVLTIMTSVFDVDANPVEIVWTHFVENRYKFRVVLDKGAG